jgi:hypothetical protein
MAEWQPIETAPKDGTPVFLLSAHQTIDAGVNGVWENPPRAYIGVWNPDGDSWTDELGNLDPANGEICTLTVTGTWSSGGGWFQPNEVTHWQPLPAPPPQPMSDT